MHGVRLLPVAERKQRNESESGTNPPETVTVAVGPARQVQLNYQMYDVEDRMVLEYAGQQIFDTGCVKGTRTVALNLSGGADRIVVRVQPNCSRRGTRCA